MKFYEPHVVEGYEWINAIDDRDYEVFLQLDGTPKRDWSPILVRRVRADDHATALAADFPWLGAHALVMRESALQCLKDLLDASGELLPLGTTDDVRLFVHNTHIVDALDEASSKLMRFPSTGRIMKVVAPVFLADRIANLPLFRLPYRASSVYVNEQFVERVRTCRLEGIEFQEVWQS